MAYCNAPDSSNLKHRYQNVLKKVDLEKKDVFLGQRWLKPEPNAKLIIGELKTKPGPKKATLFSIAGELLPRTSWSELPDVISGVYVLFDAAEVARYVGISNNIRKRIETYFTGSHPSDVSKRDMVTAFSVYGVKNRAVARELESLLIHILGPQLILNSQKKKSVQCCARLQSI